MSFVFVTVDPRPSPRYRLEPAAQSHPGHLRLRGAPARLRLPAMMPEERYIEFDVTYKCNAERRRCIFASSPRKGGLMGVEDARAYLVEIRKLGLSGADVIRTGGETLLFCERPDVHRPHWELDTPCR